MYTMKIKSLLFTVVAGLISLATVSCNKNTSNTTGWTYNDAEYGGFQVVDNYEQDTPPGTVFAIHTVSIINRGAAPHTFWALARL